LCSVITKKLAETLQVLKNFVKVFCQYTDSLLYKLIKRTFNTNQAILNGQTSCQYWQMIILHLFSTLLVSLDYP